MAIVFKIGGVPCYGHKIGTPKDLRQGSTFWLSQDKLKPGVVQEVAPCPKEANCRGPSESDSGGRFSQVWAYNHWLPLSKARRKEFPAPRSGLPTAKIQG